MCDVCIPAFGVRAIAALVVMETKDTQPLIAGSSTTNTSSDTVITPAPAATATTAASGSNNGDNGSEDGPLLPANVQQLTLSAEPKEERKGTRP